MAREPCFPRLPPQVQQPSCNLACDRPADLVISVLDIGTATMLAMQRTTARILWYGISFLGLLASELEIPNNSIIRRRPNWGVERAPAREGACGSEGDDTDGAAGGLPANNHERSLARSARSGRRLASWG